jgi:hypothetical protein
VVRDPPLLLPGPAAAVTRGAELPDAAAIERADAAAIALAGFIAPGDDSLVADMADALRSAGPASSDLDGDARFQRAAAGATRLLEALDERALTYVIDWHSLPEEVLQELRKLAARACGDQALWSELEERQWEERSVRTPALVDLLVTRVESRGVRVLDPSTDSDTFTLVPAARDVYEQACLLAMVGGSFADPHYVHGRFGAPPPGARR